MDAREFALMIETLGEDMSSEELEEALSELDTDGSGKIGFDEFLSFWCKLD